MPTNALSSKPIGSAAASLVLTGLVTIDGGNSGLSYTSGTGAQIYSQTNLPIIGYASTTTDRCGLRNINIVGVATAGTSQNGVMINPTYPAQLPIDIENIAHQRSAASATGTRLTTVLVPPAMSFCAGG